ncbi:MAG: AtpZ/AtpI family protein [Candidatus Pacebacteria bacterium]|nr:AtpZ/AtpI family protein [Candidatus Paceibacterota bacterium]
MKNIENNNPKEIKTVETQQEKTRRTNREVFMALELVSKLGISVAIIAATFVLSGIYLDQVFGTKYIFVILGLGLSIIVSLYDIYYLLEPFIGSEKRKNFLKRKGK